MTVRMRQEVERKIIEALITAALGRNYEIAVNDGETCSKYTDNFDVIMTRMFSVDEETLMLRHPDGERGWVKLVYGNSGPDVISDYTTNLQPLMAEPDLIADYYDADGPWISWEQFRATRPVVA
jgi:hypothetical protein